MQALRKNIFKKYEPNTFIGGVWGTINTPALLALKLNIAVSRIKKFSLDGFVDLKCHIIGTYTVPAQAFKNDPDIKYYRDESNLVTQIDAEAFMNSTVNLIKFHGLRYYGNDAFNNTKIIEVNFPSLIGPIEGGATRLIAETTTLKRFYANSLFLNPHDSLNVAVKGCVNLEVFEALKLESGSLVYQDINLATPPLTGIPNIKTLNSLFMHTINGYTTITLPAIVLVSQCFYAVKNCVNYYLNEVTRINGNTPWRHQTAALKLIELKKCKELNGVTELIYNLGAVASNYTLRINVALISHPALLFCKNTQGATVEFYDDAGNYVSTL